jgi:hypothetical protein
MVISSVTLHNGCENMQLISMQMHMFNKLLAHPPVKNEEKI